ncbi:MAG TPA: carbamate kinase [candidate division Zixibacteria bacterium]|nr:carbamate kinase [candidate division Zixibacteria bacterium]
MAALNGKTAVVALGGNAITHPAVEDTIAQQFKNTRSSLDSIVELARAGYKVAITHGNGPQVGNAILRVELARDKAPILPLGICVADTEGGIGYMIEQSLQNRLKKEGIDRPVVTIITQVIIDKDDPQIANPSKFIGQFYTDDEAEKFRSERNWVMKKDANRGWRRVVPSPQPLSIVASKTIKTLVDSGTIVIAAGGGGIPVYIDENGNLEGLDAVIDKDLASVVLAKEIDSEILLILTSVDKVSLNFGTDNEKPIDTMTVAEAERYLAEGHFPPGSMGPKIKAALQFVKNGGKELIITSIENAGRALRGESGTRITLN